MKKLILVLISASLAGCSTMIAKNPEDVKTQVAQKTEQAPAPVAATPKADPERVQTVVKVVSKELQFETGKADLKPKALSALRELAEIVATEPSAKVAINGFTDNTGTDKVNKPLSLERARAVGSVLIQSGVPAERVSVEGHSSQKPLATNDSEKGRALNRRAEISLE